jgi:hypothetical protein
MPIREDTASNRVTASLTLEPISFSSGVPNCYQVLGLPDGETAEITLRITRMVEAWKVRYNDRGRFTGAHKTAEAALAVLQGTALAAPKDSE